MFFNEFPGESVPELAAYVFGYEDCYASAEDAIQRLAKYDDLVDDGSVLSHSEVCWRDFVNYGSRENDCWDYYKKSY